MVRTEPACRGGPALAGQRPRGAHRGEDNIDHARRGEAVSDGAQFRQVSPVRLYQRIVEQIEQAIARGDLKPGQRLPSERELVTQFGASRPTVREALRVLESNGLVRSRPGDPNGGYLPFTPAGLTKEMTRLVQFDNMSMAELISFRMILDGSASLLAARLRSEEELSAMERTLAVMSDAIEAGYEEPARQTWHSTRRWPWPAATPSSRSATRWSGALSSR